MPRLWEEIKIVGRLLNTIAFCLIVFFEQFVIRVSSGCDEEIRRCVRHEVDVNESCDIDESSTILSLKPALNLGIMMTPRLQG